MEILSFLFEEEQIIQREKFQILFNCKKELNGLFLSLEQTVKILEN